MLELFAERGGDPQRSGKKHPLDPLLWRVARPGEPEWDGGRSAGGAPAGTSSAPPSRWTHLGAAFDVQGGGSDLVFPHHEMSASHGHLLGAQPYARVYAHGGMVGLDGQKMSKSRGNLVLVSKLRAAGVDPAAIRLAILAHHYRSDWDWTDAGLAGAQDRLAPVADGDVARRRAGRRRRCWRSSGPGSPTTSTPRARWPPSTPGSRTPRPPRPSRSRVRPARPSSSRVRRVWSATSWTRLLGVQL